VCLQKPNSPNFSRMAQRHPAIDCSHNRVEDVGPIGCGLYNINVRLDVLMPSSKRPQYCCGHPVLLTRYTTEKPKQNNSTASCSSRIQPRPQLLQTSSPYVLACVAADPCTRTARVKKVSRATPTSIRLPGSHPISRKARGIAIMPAPVMT
jgi:hypothetical protein